MSSYVIHHRYPDGSGDGVIPLIIDERDKKLIELVLDAVGTQQDVEFILLEEFPRPGGP